MDNTFNDNEFPVNYTGSPKDGQPEDTSPRSAETSASSGSWSTPSGPAWTPAAPQEEAPAPAWTPSAPQPVEAPASSWTSPIPQQEPVSPSWTSPAPQQEGGAYSGVGTGRKESPYANSPYVMHHEPQGQAQAPQEPPVKKKAKKEKTPGTGKRIIAALLVLALVGGVCGGFAWMFQGMRSTNAALNQQIGALEKRIKELESGQDTPAAPGTSPRPADGAALSPSQLYDQCVNSVVAISSTFTAQGFYGPTEGASSGSGFILSTEGYVVTNAHVVEDASSVKVILHDKTELPAKVVGLDSSNDIAVLQIQGEVPPLKAAVLGKSSELAIGDMVAAIGNPLGELASTQTIGYISGINREVTTDNTIISMLQTDAAINPGNSGGPLFNTYGQVIGITTAKYSGTTGSGASIEGIGFAIPIDDVKRIISDLVDYGYVTGAYLGVTVRDIDPDAASLYGLPTGAYVDSVVEGVSAHRAGVKASDIIIAIGEYKVTSVTTLTRHLRNFNAGDTTTITVLRNGKELVLPITLDEKPQDLNKSQVPPSEMPSEGDFNEWEEYFRWYFGG